LDAAERRTTRKRFTKGFIAVNDRAGVLGVVSLVTLHFAGFARASRSRLVLFPHRKPMLIASRLFQIPCFSRLCSWDEHAVLLLKKGAASAGAGQHEVLATGAATVRMIRSKSR
jgi:hypothetical protein